MQKHSSYLCDNDSRSVKNDDYGTVGSQGDKYTRLESYGPAIVESSLACKGKRFKPSIDRKVVKLRVFASKAKSPHCTISEETKPEAK